MSKTSFAADLQLYGPMSSRPKPPSAWRSRRYCRKLARRHYENFTVASWLLPRRLRQHFYNVYAYCRWADDLADETGDADQSLALLGWWEKQVRDCYAGKATHPVFIALGGTIERFRIPIDPWVDLLVAFRQDQRVRRYETTGQLIEYCRYSANPVGRLVLHLGECFDAEHARLSDCICTGLQLANFCQDVARDYARGRIYLPATECHRFGFDDAMFAQRKANEPFRRLLSAQVQEAEGWLRRGLPLVRMVPEELRLDVALFVFGGLRILEEIRQQDFDVWTKRPEIPSNEKLRLALRCWWRLKRGTLFD